MHPAAGARAQLQVLAGEEVNRLFGESLRKQFIDDIFPLPIASEVAGKFDEVVETPALVWTLGPFFGGSPKGAVGECAVVPLVGDGEQGQRHALRGVPPRLDRRELGGLMLERVEPVHVAEQDLERHEREQ